MAAAEGGENVYFVKLVKQNAPWSYHPESDEIVLILMMSLFAHIGNNILTTRIDQPIRENRQESRTAAN